MSDPNQPPPPEGPGGPQAPTPPSGQPGYQAPPPGYQAPPPGYQAPPPGYQAPPPGYQAPPPGYQAPPPPMHAPSGVGQPADLLMRFLARLIDFVIVGVVLGILGGIIGAIVGTSVGLGYFGTGLGYVYVAVSAVVSAAIYLAYFSLMEANNGQTLGKMLLKLQTQGPDGRKPSLEMAVRRNLWVALGVLRLIPVVGGLLAGLAELVAAIMIAVTINNSPTRQGWHDHFAGGTKVIKIG